MGNIAKTAEADLNVICLVGERGCELRPFLEDSLGEEGLKKSIVVISSSEQLPLMRRVLVEFSLPAVLANLLIGTVSWYGLYLLSRAHGGFADVAIASAATHMVTSR